MNDTYDALGRLVSETQNGKVIQTGYDANSNITSLTYPSGKKVVRDYDVLNRLTKISHPELGQSPVSGSSAPLAAYSYSSLTLDSLALANGTKTTYGYDAILRLKELTNMTTSSLRGGSDNDRRGSVSELWDANGDIINKLSFSYDQNSNILSNGYEAYSYDSLSRLTNAGYEPTQDKKSITESFAYDPMGSRLSALVTETKTVGKDKPKVSSTTYDINNLNQYEGAKSEKNKSESYSYDKNGNLIQDDSQKYSYDYRNRLIEVKRVKENELITKYSYDVLGRRLAKDTKETLTKYTYSNNDAIEESIYAKKYGKSELTETKEYIYGSSIDDIIATVVEKYEDGKIQETKTYYYHKNQLGSITALTDESGKTFEEYRYDVFGKAYTRNGKSDNWREFAESKTGNTRLFTGREYDREIGLYYYRARFYSAELGRFISRDPIGVKDDVNLYGYVGNSPVGFNDAMGLEKVILTIYSWRENGGLAQGHAWIEITQNNIVHSYWLWPDRFNRDGEQIIWDGIQTDLELQIKETRYTSNVEQVSISLDQDKLNILNQRIEINIKNNVSWGYLAPWKDWVCSKWAADAWNLVTDDDHQLSSRNIIWISNPNSLANSIAELRNKAWSAP